jgi:hypothetical protein
MTADALIQVKDHRNLSSDVHVYLLRVLCFFVPVPLFVALYDGMPFLDFVSGTFRPWVCPPLQTLLIAVGRTLFLL